MPLRLIVNMHGHTHVFPDHLKITGDLAAERPMRRRRRRFTCMDPQQHLGHDGIAGDVVAWLSISGGVASIEIPVVQGSRPEVDRPVQSIDENPANLDVVPREDDPDFACVGVRHAHERGNLVEAPGLDLVGHGVIEDTDAGVDRPDDGHFKVSNPHGAHVDAEAPRKSAEAQCHLIVRGHCQIALVKKQRHRLMRRGARHAAHGRRQVHPREAELARRVRVQHHFTILYRFSKSVP